MEIGETLTVVNYVIILNGVGIMLSNGKNLIISSNDLQGANGLRTNGLRKPKITRKTETCYCITG